MGLLKRDNPHLLSNTDDRSAIELATDSMAAVIRGGLLAVEAEFDCNMAISGQVLEKAITGFLDDVHEAAGPEVAASYAKIIEDQMKTYHLIKTKNTKVR